MRQAETLEVLKIPGEQKFSNIFYYFTAALRVLSGHFLTTSWDRILAKGGGFSILNV